MSEKGIVTMFSAVYCTCIRHRVFLYTHDQGNWILTYQLTEAQRKICIKMSLKYTQKK